jgi:hypothetical protein
MIVCLGIDSTDRAFFLWLWKLCAGLGAKAGDEGRDAESVPGLSPTTGERKACEEALLVVVRLVVFWWRASPILEVPVTPFEYVDCWVTAGSGEGASFMEVKDGGGDRIDELFASLVSGWVVRVGVRAGWIEVPVGELRSDIFLGT